MRLSLIDVLLLITPVLAANGCATILSSDKQEVKLKAYPPDARVAVDGQDAQQGAVQLSREKQHYVDVSKDGYDARRITLKQTINPMFFVNVALLPFFWVGMLVDAMTGRMNELEPTDITVNLSPHDPSGRAAPVASTGGSSSSGIALDMKAGGPDADPLATANKTPTKTTINSPSAASTKTAGPRIDDSSPLKPAGPSGVANEKRGSALDRPKISRTPISAGQRDWVIAVMPCGATGKATFDKNTLAALTDQIRVFLAERGARVVDRSQQEAALKGLVEEEKRKSYSACVDSSCQVPLGKALAASHILRSNVAKFGKACSTNGELIDLRTEVAIAAGSSRTDCNEEELLYAAESLAEQLISGSAPKAK
jgi:hypothetical protein